MSVNLLQIDPVPVIRQMKRSRGRRARRIGPKRKSSAHRSNRPSETKVSDIKSLDAADNTIEVEVGVEHAVGSDLEPEINVAHEPEVIIVETAVQTLAGGKRTYKKRKGNVSLPRKRRKWTQAKAFFSGDKQEENEECLDDNASLQSSECCTGDDPPSRPPTSLLSSTNEEAINMAKDKSSQNEPNSISETDSTTISSLIYEELKEIFVSHNISWTLHQQEGSVRIFKLNKSFNAAISRCVSWNAGKVRIYVNNKPVPNDDLFVSDLQISSSLGIHELCLALKSVTLLVDGMTPCTGVVEFEDMWNRAHECGKGWIELGDMYDSTGCLRAMNCSLLNSGSSSVCESCSDLKKYLRRQIQNSELSEFKNLSRINNRFLPRDKLEERVKEFQSAIKNEKKKVARLQKRLKKLVEEDAIVVSGDFGEDFMKVLKLYEKDLPEIKKIFWEQQIMALSKEKNPRSMKWNPMMIKIALHLQMSSRSAYQYLHDSGLITLPSQRTLYDYSHHKAGALCTNTISEEQDPTNCDNAVIDTECLDNSHQVVGDVLEGTADCQLDCNFETT